MAYCSCITSSITSSYSAWDTRVARESCTVRYVPTYLYNLGETREGRKANYPILSVPYIHPPPTHSHSHTSYPTSSTSLSLFKPTIYIYLPILISPCHAITVVVIPLFLLLLTLTPSFPHPHNTQASRHTKPSLYHHNSPPKQRTKNPSSLSLS